jgi:hypothetical protein
MLSCQGLLWFLQNPTSHSSPLIPARGRYFVEMMPGSLPDSVFSSGATLNRPAMALPPREPAPWCHFAVGQGIQMPGLCYIRGGVVKNVARAQGPILTSYLLEGEISREAGRCLQQVRCAPWGGGMGACAPNPLSRRSRFSKHPRWQLESRLCPHRGLCHHFRHSCMDSMVTVHNFHRSRC